MSGRGGVKFWRRFGNREGGYKRGLKWDARQGVNEGRELQRKIQSELDKRNT